MDKFTFKTSDGVDVNLEKLSQAFPEVITETMGEDGKIKRVADFEKLKMLLGDSAAERPQEFYEFTWPGKNEAIFEAAKATTKTLRPCPEESKNWDTTQNLYIEGDNLEALKILQEAYLGKVKMIYIDPPYNTGKDFVYRDNFHKSAEEGKADETVRDEETDNNLFQNTESNGRFHSDWCSMIYPRLKLARDLLRDDGVIFISIDDNEVHNLRKICDEIFGESNFITSIPWQSRASIQNDTDFSVNHEYICVYAKKRRLENRRLKETNYSEWHKKDSFVCRPLPLDKSKFDNPDNDIRGLWKADPFDAPNVRPNLTYPITNPNTAEQYLPPHGRCWRTDKNQFLSLLDDNRILFGKDGRSRPQLKVFYDDKKEYGSIDNSWFSSDRIGTTTSGTKELLILFNGNKCFDTPKPVLMLLKLLYLGNTKDNDIILDFFSGSATTAHACMQLNAEDGGNRKFIMVQLPEVCAPDSEAAKAGYKNICEIGKERIRRAGEKIKAEHATTAPNLDIGFRVLKIDESIMKDVFYSPNETSQDLLSTLESNIKENRTDLDLLFACLVDWGVELSMPLKTEEINGIKVYTVNDKEIPDLIASFSENITEATIREIAKRKPLRVIFRDSSFADSPSKINVTEIFKTLSPNTTIKVL